MLKQDQIEVVVQVNGKKRALVEVMHDISEEALKSIAIERMAFADFQVSDSDRFIAVRDKPSSMPKLVNVIQG